MRISSHQRPKALFLLGFHRQGNDLSLGITGLTNCSLGGAVCVVSWLTLVKDLDASLMKTVDLAMFFCWNEMLLLLEKMMF